MTTDPSTHQLRLLLVLAEELHFGRAAKRLFISQPAFSRQIRMLEEHLGVALVERSTRRVELTSAGEALLSRVRAVVDAVEELSGAADTAAHAHTDRVVLGSYMSSLPALRMFLDRLRERHPGPEVELRGVDYVEQVSALLEGQVDAVICHGPMPEGIHTLCLGTEARFLCVHDTHPLADRESLTLAELADLPVIGFSPHVQPEWRDFWAADPRPGGTPVQYTHHAATTADSSIAYASLGHGIRFISESCRALMPRPGVRYIAVTDLRPCTAVLAWSASRPLTPALSSLQRLLRNHSRTKDTQTPLNTNGGWWYMV
ncbi:LysR substrate-binding domain-containing protein [Streptomyces sp. NPDC023998]|uniref:LysR family transcriptional regulator n=1 Tax=Streptomyces sp. NPDC023998 TaxID=3154597 RepID=UPI0033D87A75